MWERYILGVLGSQYLGILMGFSWTGMDDELMLKKSLHTDFYLINSYTWSWSYNGWMDFGHN